MIDRGIFYKEVMDLGFDREEHSDSIFFNQNGYDWFTVTKTLAKNLYIDWDCETHQVELIRWKPKGGYILNRMTLGTIEEVKKCIDFFTKKDPKKKDIKKYFTVDNGPYNTVA